MLKIFDIRMQELLAETVLDCMLIDKSDYEKYEAFIAKCNSENKRIVSYGTFRIARKHLVNELKNLYIKGKNKEQEQLEAAQAQPMSKRSLEMMKWKATLN